MMHISLDLLYVEKKLIRVGDPRLHEILNVFPNSWAGAFRNHPYITSHSQSKVQKAAMRLT